MSEKRAKFPHGFARLNEILKPNGPLPISRSAWWAGVRDGRYPKPVKLGPRITAWLESDICDLISRLAGRAK